MTTAAPTETCTRRFWPGCRRVRSAVAALLDGALGGVGWRWVDPTLLGEVLGRLQTRYPALPPRQSVLGDAGWERRQGAAVRWVPGGLPLCVGSAEKAS